ncbi:MAG TPA: methyltransferase domain-containing protein [Gaiellaceae bacterium]|nr:methyltransferase domain-containing protein [Gaiellaceae bacterium]
MEYGAAMAEVRSTLERRPLAAPRPRVLDAGCGTEINIPLPPDAYLVGIDISAEATTRNERLDERIVADLERVELAPDSFDLIVCWDVLEHLRRPERALERLAAALAPGGTFVVGVPNVNSAKGLATKFTPYAFHRWIYRRASSSTSAPFRTYLRTKIAPAGLLRWAGESGFQLERMVMYEAPIQASLRRRLRLTGRRWSAVGATVRAVSLGSVATEDTDLVAIFTRP